MLNGCNLNYNNLKYRLVAVCICISYFFTISTALRIPPYPLGPGELSLCLLAVCGFYFYFDIKKIKDPLVLFWLVTLVFMFIGAIFNDNKGDKFLRHGLAYIFAAFVTIGLVFLLEKIEDTAITFLLLCMALMPICILWVGFGLYAFASDDLLGRFLMFNTSDLRYSGWSLNPNQLALFLLPLPIWLVAIFATRLNLTAVPRLFFGTLFFAIILMGFLIRSDGLFVVWIGGFILLAVLIYLWAGRVSKLLFLIGFAIVIASAAIIKIFAHGDVRTTVNCSYHHVLSKEENWKGKCLDERFFKDEELYRIGFTDPNSKIIIRRVLWSHGLDVWLTSPFIGWGPGEYSWLDTEIEGVRTELMESHNILVDLLTQGGLLVGIAWILVILNLLVKSWRAKDPFTFVVVFVVLMFTFFHNTRQPYLWFVLAISSVVVRRNIFSLSTNKPVL